jgi:hypothetical protein
MIAGDSREPIRPIDLGKLRGARSVAAIPTGTYSFDGAHIGSPSTAKATTLSAL